MSFASHTDPAAVDALRARLRATRFTTLPDDAAWTLGTDPAYLRDLVAYWADGFDWPGQEDALNRLPRKRLTVGGLGIHVIHAASGAVVPAGAGRRPPLLLAHGWPDSFWRYLKVLPLLADDFELVIPDMPGFGYSDQPPASLDTRGVAALWADLMTQLGFDRFFVAGGDMGSHVARYLALDFPDRVIAVHRMDAGLPAPGMDAATLSPEEREWFAGAVAWGAAEGAYVAVQRTKPNTIAAALADSPAGMAAWIVEKFHAWSDGGLQHYTMDDILVNLSIYWFTQTIGTSMRIYRANGLIPPEQLARRVEVPSGFSLFAGDVVRPPRAWLERSTNLAYYAEPRRGGHFAPFEVPDLYAAELRAFFGKFGAGA